MPYVIKLYSSQYQPCHLCLGPVTAESKACKRSSIKFNVMDVREATLCEPSGAIQKLSFSKGNEYTALIWEMQKEKKGGLVFNSSLRFVRNEVSGS